MKILITESQYNNLFVKRRMEEVWNLVMNSYPYMYPCDFDKEDFILAICDDIYWVVWFEDWDESLADTVREFIMTHYNKRLLDIWDHECKK